MLRCGLAIWIVSASLVAGSDYVSFHGAGTGVFPDADLPVIWAANSARPGDGWVNIQWCAEMPNWSNSQPVAKDGRVYVMAEPVESGPILLCLDEMNGNILWQREIHRFEEPLRSEWIAYYTGCQAARRSIMKGEKPPAVEKTPALQELAKQGALFPNWGVGGGGAGASGGDGVNSRAGQWVGWAFPAPLTNGKHVWVWTWPGVAAGFDRNGMLVWQRTLDWRANAKNPESTSYTAAPLCVDGVLILLGGEVLYGLDPFTGEVRWQQSQLHPQGWHAASPMVVRVGGTTAVFTMDGAIYRVRDGHRLLGGLGYKDSFTVHNDTVFMSGKVAQAEGKVGDRTWAVRVMADRPDTWSHQVCWDMPGFLAKAHHQHKVVYYDGWIYSNHNAWNARTGELGLGMSAGGSSPIKAGPWYLTRMSDDEGRRPSHWPDGRRYDGPSAESYVHVYDFATQRLLSINALPEIRAEGAKRDFLMGVCCNTLVGKEPRWQPNGKQTLFADGRRLYIRTHDHLWCMAADEFGTTPDDPATVSSIQAATSVTALMPYLSSTRPRYRYDAVRRAVTVSAKATEVERAALIAALNERFDKDASPRIRAEAMLALNQVQTRSGTTRLWDILAAQDTQKQYPLDLLTMLRHLPESLTTSVVCRLLEDTEEARRWAGLHTLRGARLRSAEIEAVFQRLLGTSDSSRFCGEIAVTILQHGMATPALYDALMARQAKETDLAARGQMLTALGNMFGAEAEVQRLLREICISPNGCSTFSVGESSRLLLEAKNAADSNVPQP